MTLAILIVIGAVVYAAAVLALLGRSWLGTILKDVGTAAEEAPAKEIEQPSPEEASAALPDNPPPPAI